MRIQSNNTTGLILVVRAMRMKGIDLPRLAVLFEAGRGYRKPEHKTGLDSVKTAPVNFTNEDIC
jgi:hypothetical protein